MCAGTAFEDDCGNCSEAGTGNYTDNGYDIFNAYNDKHGTSLGIAFLGVETNNTGKCTADDIVCENNVGNVCECNAVASSLSDFKTWDCAYDCVASNAISSDYFYFYDRDGDSFLGDTY